MSQDRRDPFQVYLNFNRDLSESVSHSVRSNSLRPPWTAAYQVPLSMEFSRQECWSGLPFTSPGALPNPRVKPGSPAFRVDFLLSELPGNRDLSIKVIPQLYLLSIYYIPALLQALGISQQPNKANYLPQWGLCSSDSFHFLRMRLPGGTSG